MTSIPAGVERGMRGGIRGLLKSTPVAIVPFRLPLKRAQLQIIE